MGAARAEEAQELANGASMGQARHMHSVHCEKKSHPETDGIGEGAAPAPPHLNVAGGAWGSRAAEKSTISTAQYTACKSPTLRCGGAGAAPAAFVPVPWYFFSQCTEPHSKTPGMLQTLPNQPYAASYVAWCGAGPCAVTSGRCWESMVGFWQTFWQTCSSPENYHEFLADVAPGIRIY